MIMVMLGGMMGPTVAAAATIEATYPGRYPASFIGGMVTEPTAAASAADEPAVLAMATQESMGVWPGLRRMWPTTFCENSLRPALMPPRVMMAPASMK